MLPTLEPILRIHNIFYHSNQGLTFCNVKDNEQAITLMSDFLYALVDKRTALYLSGGKTPKELYRYLAQEEKLIAGAVGQVDERYGSPFHKKSNQKMFDEAGLLRYLHMRDMRFYPILKSGNNRESTAQEYDEQFRSLNATFQSSVAIVGIGNDGHTAGIPASNIKFGTKNSKVYDTYDFVTEYNDTSGSYGERVTMTFLGLSMIDVLLVLVLGEDKKEALEKMFTNGSEEEIPARFYKRPEIAKKTLLITDQTI